MIRLLLWPFVAVLVVTGAYLTGRFASDNRALPTIAVALTGNEPEFSAQIDERIHALFPIGSAEAKLIDYLDAEGFAPGWQRAGEPRSASFVRRGLLCNKIVRIVWRPDEHGLLTEIDGSYAGHCF